MSGENDRKVLLIGWDAADWKVASPLIDEGRMPNLEKLIDTGVMGNIATLYPVLSPMLWTSIATGKRAYKHGVHGFAEPDPRTGTVRPITNLSRKCKAVWNILNQNGKKCNVVGWWPSHPAEPLNGVMVSNRFQQIRASQDKPWTLPPGIVHPKRIHAPLKKHRIHPAELEAAQILPFVPKAAEVDQDKDKRLGSVAKILSENVSIHSAATAIMQLEPWDFMAVYFDGIDHFGHGFMKYHPPRLDWISEEDYELYKDVINGAYQFHDMMLGTYLHLAGSDTTVILMSDHGFHSDQLRPKSVSNEPAGPADEHRDFGMLVMAGPGLRRDELVHGASLLDIAPTVLQLFGLPVGRDMDGRVLSTAFEQSPQIETIDSWENIDGDDGRHPPGMQIDPVDTHESLQQLVALGYIEKPDENKEKAAAQTIRELQHNLARAYMGGNRYVEAIAVFEKLWDDFPDESRFGVKIFECNLALDRTAEAHAVLGRLHRQKKQYAAEAVTEIKQWKKEREDSRPEDLTRDEHRRLNKLRRRAKTSPTAFAYLHGSLLHAEKKFDEALEFFRKAEKVQVHHRPSLYQKMGDCYVAQRRYRDAKFQFERVLEIDPINPQPYLGLARCHLSRRKPKQALTAATASVGLMYFSPRGHLLCGQALQWLRRYDEALSEYNIAVTQNPVFPEAHRRLAKIYRRTGETQLAQQHADFAKASVARLRAFRSGRPLPEDVDLELDIDLSKELSIGERAAPQAPAPITKDTVVIVSGLPRSGTSMMMQMLEAAGVPILTDNNRLADASNARGYYEYEPVKRMGRDNSWLNQAKGKAVKVIAQLLPGLRPLKSDTRIIFMQRPLEAIVTSQTTMLKQSGQNGARLSNRQLATSYRKQIDQVRRIIESTSGEVTVLPVSYETALESPAETASAVSFFLGGGLDEAAMTAAVAPQLRRH